MTAGDDDESWYQSGPVCLDRDASTVFNGEKITIKGDLAAKQGDSYHLRLTLTE